MFFMRHLAGGGEGKTFCGKRAARGLSAVASLSSLHFPALSAGVLTKAEPPPSFSKTFYVRFLLLSCAQKQKAGHPF